MYVDDRGQYTPGWKYNEWELKGVPLRVETGPRDIKNKQVTIVRRDTGEKTTAPSDSVEARIVHLLDEIQKTLLEKATQSLRKLTSHVDEMNSFKRALDEKGGFIKAYLCDDVSCEDSIKQETGATVRLVPFEHKEQGNCVYCGSKGSKMVYFARSY